MRLTWQGYCSTPLMTVRVTEFEVWLETLVVWPLIVTVEVVELKLRALPDWRDELSIVTVVSPSVVDTDVLFGDGVGVGVTAGDAGATVLSPATAGS